MPLHILPMSHYSQHNSLALLYHVESMQKESGLDDSWTSNSEAFHNTLWIIRAESLTKKVILYSQPFGIKYIIWFLWLAGVLHAIPPRRRIVPLTNKSKRTRHATGQVRFYILPFHTLQQQPSDHSRELLMLWIKRVASRLKLISFILFIPLQRNRSHLSGNGLRPQKRCLDKEAHY